MTSHQLRDTYLAFLASKGHTVLPSASLIPENDPSTLFTGSGMQPMVPYLLGQKHPSGLRLTDSQKCFRSQDIEEVGDNRHTTFFEMLGNWSLGDYFKKEQINWMFEFLTKEIGLDPQRLYVTVFRGSPSLHIPRDEEAVSLWKACFASVGMEATDIDFSEEKGMQSGRIFYYPEEKNWWSRSGVPENMPVGEPGGPDSEMFWDFGTVHDTRFGDVCHVNCDCGRFLEIGNNVFMEYVKTEKGFEKLKQANVDFGGGLERLKAALNNDPDVFRIDLFDDARHVLERIAQTAYGADADKTMAFRVILDHVRAATFLIADGVTPSNKDQGYYVRRLVRRAIRFGYTLGVKDSLCAQVAAAYIQTYRLAYPALESKRAFIIEELEKEEAKFKATLEKGLHAFEKFFDARGEVSGIDAFNLYQSYGFPWELTEELAREKGQAVDRSVFEAEFKKHQDLSRAGSQQKFVGGLADHGTETVKLHTATHLLHQALRTVLGTHVLQKGSNITSERLRFDFFHPQKMTPEQRQQVEMIVNEQIRKDLPVHFEILDVVEAKAKGAIGVFDDKYALLGNKVKVYMVGDQALGTAFSKEVCGGPHVEHTGLMGTFAITKEEAVSKGVRRIKAVLKP